eukprot:8087340-Pyramimonas_sp.AAC.1
MRSAHEVVTDENVYFSFLAVAPRDFRDLLEAGAQRWQMRRVQQHLPGYDGEVLWYGQFVRASMGPVLCETRRSWERC